MMQMFLFRCSVIIVVLQIIAQTRKCVCNCFQTAPITSRQFWKNKLSTSLYVKEYTVTLHYENSSCDIKVRSNETLLSAIEGSSLEHLGLPNHAIPSDCRRGNCLTCTASSLASSRNNVVCDDDGLSPFISQMIKDKKYVITCSSRVIGEGLHLRLGDNHKVWKDIYHDRFDADLPVAWAAMAKTKRLSDERNFSRWKNRTEKVLLSDSSSGSNN